MGQIPSETLGCQSANPLGRSSAGNCTLQFFRTVEREDGTLKLHRRVAGQFLFASHFVRYLAKAHYVHAPSPVFRALALVTEGMLAEVYITRQMPGTPFCSTVPLAVAAQIRGGIEAACPDQVTGGAEQRVKVGGVIDSQLVINPGDCVTALLDTIEGGDQYAEGNLRGNVFEEWCQCSPAEVSYGECSGICTARIPRKFFLLVVLKVLR